MTTTAATPVPVESLAVEVRNSGFMMDSVGPPFVPATLLPPTLPPAPPREVVPTQPSPDHVWLDGYWTWRDDGYAWMAGHWALPPSPDAVWITARWEEFGRGYEFHEGHWN
jgi:WXXGXW repeat (2 copies)